MAKRKPRIEIFRDARFDWAWRVRSANGRIIGCSGEGYKNRSHCIRMAKTVCNPGFGMVEQAGDNPEKFQAMRKRPLGRPKKAQ